MWISESTEQIQLMQPVPAVVLVQQLVLLGFFLMEQ